MGRIADAIRKAEVQRESQRVLTATRPDTLTAPFPASDWRSTSLCGDRSVSAAPEGTIAANLFGPITSREVAWEVHPSVVAQTDKTCAVTEQFRAIRTWLLARMTPGGRCCHAITSAVPREGKSVTTANLAVAMAEVRHLRVLVVDSDLRQSALARLFKLPASPGMADVLAGRVSLGQALQQTPLDNLSFLPAGDGHGINTTELLNSRTIGRMFDEIRETFHYVLVDTPPVQRLSDVGVIGALCDGVMMVVRMHATSSQLVRQSVRSLQANQLNVVGCIASACRPHVDRYAYESAHHDD